MRRSPVRRPVALCAGVLAAAAFATAFAQQPDDQPPAQIFRGGTDAVLVDVYPQRDGRIVEGLTADQFEVLEDGEPQRIDSFEFVRLAATPRASVGPDPNTVADMRAQAADPHNRVFVTFLDTGHTTVEGSNRIRKPLIDMLDRVVGPTDLFGVMTPAMRPRDVTLGRSSVGVEQQLTDYWSWGRRQTITSDPTDPMEDQLTACFHQRQVPDAAPNQHITTGFEDWYVDDGASARRYLDQVLIDRRREDRVFTSLGDLVTWLGQMREARSVVVAVTDGWPLFERATHLEAEPARDARFYGSFPRPGDGSQSGPGATPRQTQGVLDVDRQFAGCVQELNRLVSLDGDQQLRDLIALANRNNVSFYPVASAGLTVFDSTLGDRRQPVDDAPPTALAMGDMTRQVDRVNALKTVADATDGIAITSTNDLDDGMRRIVEDVSAYYLLTYVSTNPTRDGRYRRIEVHVKAPDLSVRARRGYVATEASDLATAEPAGPPPVAAGVTRALDVLERLRPSAEAFSQAALVGREVHTGIEVATGGGRRWTPGTPVAVAITTDAGTPLAAAGGELDANGRTAAITLSAPDGEGPWRVTFTVGTDLDRVQEQAVLVRPADDVLGEPLVSRARPSSRSPLRPAPSLQFARIERVHVEWPVLSPTTRREARLLDVRGQPLPLPVRLGEAAAGGTDLVTADVTLSPLAAGDYVIELTTEAATGTQVRYVGFRVTN